MSNIQEKQEEADWQLLYEQLERRYGPALAQDIVDQIRKAESSAETPDYMVLKALSEACELFRCEARAAVRALRSRVTDDEEQRRRDLEIAFRCYRRSQRGFSRLSRRFMGAYVPVPSDTYRHRHRKSETGCLAA